MDWIGAPLKGRCSLMGIYFVFSPSTQRQSPTHIAHIGKAPRAQARTEALPKSAILPTHPYKFYYLFSTKKVSVK